MLANPAWRTARMLVFALNAMAIPMQGTLSFEAIFCCNPDKCSAT